MENQTFTQEELDQIRQIQTNYQTVGLNLVQIKLALQNAKNEVLTLEAEEQVVADRILEINGQERALAKQLEQKYGKGEIDLESGIFTPTS